MVDHVVEISIKIKKQKSIKRMVIPKPRICASVLLLSLASSLTLRLSGSPRTELTPSCSYIAGVKFAHKNDVERELTS